MNNKKGNISFFDNLRGFIKKSFCNIFINLDSDLVNQQNNKKTGKEIKEPLEKRIENKVNKIIILEELSTLREKFNLIENRLKEILELNIDEYEKEKLVLALKSETEEMDTLYSSSIESNLSIIDENIEFDRLQITDLLKKCDKQLLEINKYKKIKEEDEQEIVYKIMNDNQKEQSNDIEQLKDSVKKVESNKKRSTLVIEIHNFLNKTIDIGINLIPTNISKNIHLGILVSVVVLNNRIRQLRKIMRKENSEIEVIKYKDIIEILKDNELIVEKTKELLVDSLYQLKNLKQEFEIEFYYDMDRYNETEDIMVDFASIEYEITSKKNELEELLNK